MWMHHIVVSDVMHHRVVSDVMHHIVVIDVMHHRAVNDEMCRLTFCGSNIPILIMTMQPS